MKPEEIGSKRFWETEESVCIGLGTSTPFENHFPRACVAFQTSGSSGVAKWIVHTKEALLHSARAVNSALLVTEASCWGLVLPIHHVGGFGVMARAYAAGCGYCIFREKWNAGMFCQWVETNAITHLSLVPTQVYDLVSQKITAPRCLVALVVGGGHLPEGIGQEARDLAWPILASYGMTEAASQIATQKIEHLSKPFAASPLEVLPIWEVQVDSEQGLSIRGKSLFCGAIKHGCFHEREGDWFMTQDRSSLNGKGLIPLGRVDSLRKISGELVDVESIRRRFLQQVQGSSWEARFAVMALPDARREHALYAVFEGRAEEFQSAFDLYQSDATGLERFTSVVYFDAFPRTDLGKIRSAELEKQSLQKIGKLSS